MRTWQFQAGRLMGPEDLLFFFSQSNDLRLPARLQYRINSVELRLAAVQDDQVRLAPVAVFLPPFQHFFHGPYVISAANGLDAELFISRGLLETSVKDDQAANVPVALDIGNIIGFNSARQPWQAQQLLQVVEDLGQRFMAVQSLIIRPGVL